MGRNKYIYALADYAFVVSSSFGLKAVLGRVSVEMPFPDSKISHFFVRLDGAVSEGNQQLHNQGAKAFPAEPWNGSLRELLTKAASLVESVQTEVETTTQETILDIHPQDIYQAVLPLLFLIIYKQPKETKSLAESLDVRQSQMQDWLNRA
ncbi:DNA-processing protein DprA, partial [Nostoc sp. HG1]|nr:DNA-processing protein DprA [Nostoc sp. HG1]